jgi:WD40 repeat protein
MKPCGRFPLISPLLYRLSVQRVARRAAAGDVPAVRELAAVFCTSPSPKTRFIAGQGLRLLKTMEQIDLLCQESLLRDNDDLLALACLCQYLPSGPAEQALWFFSTSRLEDLHRLDPEDYCPLLAAGYRRASAAVRARARSAACTNGSCSLLARTLAGPVVTQHAGDWSYDEWEIVVRGLIGKEQWEDLWLLVFLAPLPLAHTAITALKKAGWTPPGDDKLLWDDIIAALPDRWTCPVPAGQVRDPVGRPASQVSRLCFSPDGSLLATGCCDGMVAVCRTASPGAALEFSAVPGSIRFLALSADNAHLVYGGDDGMVHAYSLQDRACIWSWEGYGGATALTLSPDSRSVFISDEKGILHVLDIRDGRVLLTIPLHPSPVTSITLSPCDSTVACGHVDGTVSLADSADTSSLRILCGNDSPVRSLTFSTVGTELLVICEQVSPTLWNVASGTKTRVFSGSFGRSSCSAVSAEGGWFALGGDDHMLRCWKRGEPLPATVIPQYSRQITCCSAVPEGSLLATGFHDGTIRIYHMPKGRLLREYKGHQKTIISCAMSPDGDRLATVSWDGTTKLWRLPKGEILRTLDAHAGGIISLAGPAGTLIATVTEDGFARILEGPDSAPVRTIDLYTPSVRAAAVSADGMYLASTGADATLRCWTIRDGGLAASGDHLATSLRCCTFLPDTSALVTGGWDGACRFFRVPDLRLLRTIFGHTSMVTCCAVSRDGSLLVTGSNDTTVRLWRISDTEAYAVLRESRSEVGAVALSPDETLLATGSADGMIRFFRLPHGTPAGELPVLPGKVTSLAFTPDGCILAAGFDCGTCTLLSLPEKAILRAIPAHSGAVTGIAILPDGRTLVTAGRDGMCRFHPLPLTPFLVHACLADIPAAVSGETSARGSAGGAQWAFLLTLLTARFRGEIEICPPLDVSGCYDIQIVG